MSVATVRQPTRLCHSCEQRLNSVSDAMRRHATLVAQGIKLSRLDHTEEERLAFGARLVETFIDAQKAWDTYREHLIEHGILPSA